MTPINGNGSGIISLIYSMVADLVQSAERRMNPEVPVTYPAVS